MASSKKQKMNDNAVKSTEKYFTWSDEETSLLIKVALSYKAEKTTEGKDWESVKTRYEDLLKDFLERYPKSTSDDTLLEYFPNQKNLSVFDKEKVISKFKRIKQGFRKAVDSGRKSGGGRVVALFFEECSELWSGSPAVEAIDNGIETSQEISQADDSIAQDSDSDDNSTEAQSLSDVEESIKKTADSRRNLIFKLKEKKNSKLTKKVTTENRMLALEKEELELRKRLVDHLESSEKKCAETMHSFATSLNSLSTTLQNGFNMLGMMMEQNHNQQYNIHPQYHQTNNRADAWNFQEPPDYQNL